jgi:serine/threonine-protein kinase
VTSQRTLPPDIPDLGDGRFQILERIGAGGMGTVYKAIQKSVGRPVAIKVLSSEHAANASGVTRFVREANVVSRLVHPNIVSVIDFGRDAQGNLLLVMELLDGETLRQCLRRQGRLAPSRAVGVATQVLAALRVAHGAGIVHRDLKPENVFMCRVDGADLIKVLDFGVAKLVASEVGDQTTAGSLVGTLRYMAPEQIAGDPPDGRVDLYATGIVLYEMLSGSLPYESKDRFQLLRAVLNDPPIPLAIRAPELPAELCDVVMRAIAKHPDQRFQSAEELRAALAPFLGRGAALTTGEYVAAPVGSLEPPSPVTGSARLSRGELSAPGGDATVASRPGARAPAPPPVFEPPGAAKNEFTTAAGLSAASRSFQAPTPRSSAFVVGAVAVGVLSLVSSAGILWLRSRGETAPVVRPSPVTTAAQSPVPAPVPTGGSVVLVRTEPAGATLRDTASGEVLCSATPCAVVVAAGHARRVTLAHGALTMQALLEPGVSPFLVDLRTGATPAPTAALAVATADAGAPPTSPSARPPRRLRNTGNDDGLQMFGPRRGGDLQMFGPRPR